jgi:hypothetical protein
MMLDASVTSFRCRTSKMCYDWSRYILDGSAFEYSTNFFEDLYGNAWDYAGWWVYFAPKNVELSKDRLHYYVYADFINNQHHDVVWDPAVMRERYQYVALLQFEYL